MKAGVCEEKWIMNEMKELCKNSTKFQLTEKKKKEFNLETQ